MLKNTVKAFAAVCFSALLGFSAVGCDYAGIVDTNEQTAGKSAYEIALENGFKGSEADWLLSLKGADGKDADSPTILEIYEAWLTVDGNAGSFNDFLAAYLDGEVGSNNNTRIIHENLTSVVSIACATDYRLTISQGGFFGESETVNYKQASAGSGVIVDLDKEAGNAYVITNYHVVYGAGSVDENCISDEIFLYPYGGYTSFQGQYTEYTVNGAKKKYLTGVDGGDGGISATYVAGSMNYDIALLKVEGSAVLRESAATEAVLGDSEDVTVGEKVFAIGNPEGDGISVSEGVLSVDSENIEMTAADEKTSVVFRVMRTDAAINHGNSGGGLFDSQGRLIGIVSAKNVEDDVDNMGYALPITQLKYVIQNMVDNGGQISRAMLGVTVQTVASKGVWDEVKKRVDIVEEIGIVSVDEGSIAYGKLQAGDVFKSVQIGDEQIDVTRSHLMIDRMFSLRLGDSMKVTVLRGGVEYDFTFTFDNEAHFKTIA